GARDKSLAATAAKHSDADTAIFINRRTGCGEAVVHCPGHRVARPGSIELDMRYAVSPVPRQMRLLKIRLASLTVLNPIMDSSQNTKSQSWSCKRSANGFESGRHSSRAHDSGQARREPGLIQPRVLRKNV